jgi:Zn-dependent protease with chaperone function
MPCLLLILLLAFPRIALALLFFFSNYLERAYHGLILPLLGFVFLPITTLAYAQSSRRRAKSTLNTEPRSVSCRVRITLR